MTPDVALPLLIIALGAVAMPVLARVLGIPVAIAEIAFGIAAGHSGIGLVHPSPFIAFLADVGFAFFMFVAGMEIDFGIIERRGVRGWLVGLGGAIGSVAVALYAGDLLGWSPWTALAAAATSVGLLLSVLRDVGLDGTPQGAVLLSLGAIGEIVTIVVVSTLHVHAEHPGAFGAILGIVKLAGLAAAVVACAVALRALLWWFPRPFTRIVAHDDPSEIGVRFGFGLMFAFVALSLIAGLEPFLGAFVAGAALAWVLRRRRVLEHKLASMAYGFFVPVFFIYVGVRLEADPALVAAHIVDILSVAAFMLAVKLVASVVLLAERMRLRTALGAILLFASPLTLLIAIVDVGRRVGALDATTESVVVLGGMLGSLVYPTAARRLLRTSKADPEDAHDEPDEPPAAETAASGGRVFVPQRRCRR